MLNNTKIIRNGSNCGAGCVGGFFSMPGSSNKYGISNNHVLANFNNCSVGDPIMSDDTGKQIGTLTHWIPLKGRSEHDKINYFDMALFKLNDDLDVAWQMNDDQITRPPDFIEPRLNGNVYMKLDDGTFRTGYVTKSSINNIMEFELCGLPFLFTKLIEITPTNGGSFSVPGDSGCIILSSTHYIVGLLLGTNSDATKSYAIPFRDGILKYVPLKII